MPETQRPIPSLKPRHFPPPPPLVQKSPGRWRRTPPAIFPPMMGLFGLGLAWRTLATQPAMQPLAPIGEAILGAALLLFAFGLIAWLSKPLRRPGVILEEIGVLPGRAGLAAMILCLMLAGAALTPYAPSVAVVLAFVGGAALVAYGVLTAVHLLRGPKVQRAVNPIFHLTFVGYILMPLSLAQLGYTELSTWILWGSAAVALVIWLVSLRQLIGSVPPAPLRPILAIHLAPASVLATVAALLGHELVAAGFALIALAMLVALVGSARWLLASGFSPLWGALTFPLAACATASMLGLGAVGFWIGAALLLAATALNPWIAMQVVKTWANGQLGAKTNAATA